MTLKLLLIATFGALGSVLRYLLARWAQHVIPVKDFPTGTLVVNLIGCVGIGLSGAYFLGQRPIREEFRLAVMVGLLGGFTTFSAFAWETSRLAASALPASALANVLLSNVLGLACADLAYRLGVRLFGG